jgi:hypothetical protein
MDMKAAMKILDPIMPLYERDSSDAEVAGLALCVLLRNGYWDIAFDSKDDGSLVLIAGNIELRDPREMTPVGELQRSTQLLVRAAALAEKGGG